MKFANTFLTALFLVILFTTSSCSDNEMLEETIVVTNENTLIVGIESEDFITIRVEALSDITDNREGETNEKDYCNISFDINSNNEIDSEIDFGYESPTKYYDICSYYFLEEQSITHCGGHPTEAVFEESFASSDASTTPHMIWTLTIPKEELNQKRTLSFTVKTIDKGIFKTFPPTSKNNNALSFDFSETLTFRW